MRRIQSDCHEPDSTYPLKMKYLIVLAIVVACASADLASDAAAAIVRTAFDINPDGNAFSYGYETGNKIAAQVEGVVKNPTSNEPTLEVKGSYSYLSPDGTPIDTTYVANEGGYQPQGSHLPVPPPIPQSVVRALEYIAAHPPPVDSKKY